MIIVTGGAGFIGSNILAALEREMRSGERAFDDLVVVDRLRNGDKWRNIAKRELAEVVAPERLPEFLAANVSEIDAIVHMGAISATTERDVDLIADSNIRLTRTLWDFCRDEEKRLIFASSAATYGGGELGFDDRDDLEYLNALRPLNAYGWSKAFIDRKIARDVSLGRKTPKQFVGLKFFNVYGPNEYHKGGQKSVVAHLYPLVERDEETLLFKSHNPNYRDGEQLRDFVWVGDVANVVLWALDNPSVSGLFNVGSGEARSFYDLAKATWDAAGKTPKIAFKDMPEELRGKYQYYTKANMDKLRAAGYDKPSTSLEEGVRIYVQEFLSREDAYL